MRKHVIKFLFLLILPFVFLQTIAQSHELSGCINDRESELPIEDVTVYINGTSKGTTTNFSGKFTLLVDHLPCELILSHVSYQLERISLQDPGALSGLNLTLQKRLVELEEATVFSEALRAQYIDQFKSWFLGANYKEQKAEILNDSILQFQIYDSRQFSVEATEPILVLLPITGYLLKVDLVHFHLLYKEELNGYHCSILGYYFFDPRVARSRREQRNMARARVHNFYNSSMHFCRSLFHNQLAENGYIFENSCLPEPESAYSKDYRFDIKTEYISDDFGNELLMLTHSSCKDFQIIYHENARRRPVDLTYLSTERSASYYSNFRFLADTVRIHKSGRIPGNTIVFGNSIGEKGIAYMLPEDYIPSMQ